MVPEHHRAALHLATAGGFGPHAYHALKDTPDPAAILALDPDQVRPRLKPQQFEGWQLARDAFTGGQDHKIAKALEHLARGAQLATPVDENFPDQFTAHDWSPFMLFLSGHKLTEALRNPCVAMVGSRQASPYGLMVARDISGALAREGITIISGAAWGIDAECHDGAIDAGGLTVAVLGTPLGSAESNWRLRERIAHSGGCMTEMTPDVKHHAGAFVQRNRLISGLASVVVVVEGEEGSGSLHTAEAGRKQGKGILAVPGDVNKAKSFAPNWLLRKGLARAVTSAHDVLVALNLRSEESEAPAAASFREAPEDPKLEGSLAAVFNCLGRGVEVGVDDVAERAGLSATEVARGLLELELRGLCRRDRGGVYTRLV